MLSSRGILRGATGVLGLAVTAGVVTAALVLPLPSHTVAAPSVRVAPVPTAQQRVCPGPILALAADSRDAGTAASFGVPLTVSGAAQSSDRTGDGTRGSAPAPIGPQISTLASGGSGQGKGSPLLLTVPAAEGDGMPPLVAGAQTQKATEEDLAGFAAAGCGSGSGDSWLVGGASDLGETSLVLLTNPSPVAAQVDLEVYGASGRVQTPGGTGITVAAGAQKVVPLAGLAPSVAAPVVHVQTHGGQVLATMQQSIVNGIDPAGVELTGATGAPALRQQISGVMVRTLAALKASQSTDGYGRDLPAVRVLVPGTSPAHVNVGVVGETGTATGDTYSATVKPGVVTEIPLRDLTDGDFTATVTSDQPVVAAARTSIESKTGKDFAWFTSSAPLPARFLVPVASGPGGTLHLFNSTTTAAGVTVTTPHGDAHNVSIPGGAAVGFHADGPGVYGVTGAAGLVASVGYSGDGALSSFAIQPPPPTASPLIVYPR